LNVQKRIVAVHHIDIPWKPSELEQRNGRAGRQGNWLAKMFRNNKVRTYIYAVGQSLDNYKFNLLKNKQIFISQMKNCELNVRTIDEGAMDEKSGMNFSEYIAILSGDTSLLEKTKLEKKIAVTESLKRAHFKELSGAKFQLTQLVETKEETTATLEKLKGDEQVYNSRLQVEKDGSKANPIQLNGLASADPEAIGRHLISIYLNWKEGTAPKLGKLYGFDLYVKPHQEVEYIDGQRVERRFNTLYAERPETGIKYTYNQGHPNIDNPKLAARYFLNAIDRVTHLKEKYTEKLQELDKEIPLLQQIMAKPFEKEQELAIMKTTLANLEREITLKIQENQMQEQSQETVPAQVDLLNELTQAGTKETMVIKMEPNQVPQAPVLQPRVISHVRKRGLKM
jgi:hypothetical protein